MIGKRRVLGIIPARGGSKGVPRKNLRILGGIPLLEWTIRAAIAADAVDEIVVTSDDEEILSVAARAGAGTIRRPAWLARDDTPGVDPVLHAVEEIGGGFEVVCCLQPTSPLRGAGHIDAAANLLQRARADSCVSVVRPSKHPAWMYERVSTEPESLLRPLWKGEHAATRRQDLPVVFALNGAIYYAETHGLLQERNLLWGRCVGYEMDLRTSLDIDTLDDLAYAEFLLARGIS